MIILTKEIMLFFRKGSIARVWGINDIIDQALAFAKLLLRTLMFFNKKLNYLNELELPFDWVSENQ
jgi:hypothetical protein